MTCHSKDSDRPHIKGIDGEDSLLSKSAGPVEGIDYHPEPTLGERDHEAAADNEEEET